MRVRLKGLNCIRKRLADGTHKTYWYAWKGGPSLPGSPGSAEFMAAYNEAVARKLPVAIGTLHGIIRKYQESAEFAQLAPRTRSDYLKHLRAIEREFGTFPVAALKQRRARTIFLEWKDRLALRSLRQADYAWTVFARCISWAVNRGLVDANPLERGGRLYHGTRAEKVWTEEDEERLLAFASPQLKLAFMLALWSGQRQGDLLRLPWSSYDGKRIRLQQSKTGARVEFPAAEPLRALLDTTPRKSPIILTQKSGAPWTADGFRSSWKKAMAKSGINGLTFHDLRGTAVTRLAIAGCTEAQIASITGHSLRDVRSILDVHYLNRDPALADAAIAKLEKGTKKSN
jgi:integrase